MDLSTRATGSVSTVALNGDLDERTAYETHVRVMALIPRYGKLILDMTDVAYMSSAGIRGLLLVHHHAKALGSEVILSGLSDNLRETMTVTGFIHLFTMSDKERPT